MLFFKALVKKTQKLKYTSLRYKFIFWNSIQSILKLSETHSLDYNAEHWAVAEISALHKHMIYDSATLFSFFEYCDPSAIFLRIKEMTVDFETFPTTTRSFEIFKDELTRVKFELQYANDTEKILNIKKNLYFFNEFKIFEHRHKIKIESFRGKPDKHSKLVEKFFWFVPSQKHNKKRIEILNNFYNKLDNNRLKRRKKKRISKTKKNVIKVKFRARYRVGYNSKRNNLFK